MSIVRIATGGTIPEQWADRAACRRHDPDLWWPAMPKGHPSVGRQREASAEAPAVCATCPVATPCRDWARTDPAGRWCVAGGEVPAQRPEVVEWRRTQADKRPDGVFTEQASARLTHGIDSTYRRGCRCAPCRQAHTTHRRKERAA